MPAETAPAPSAPATLQLLARPESLSDTVYAAIREAIVRKQLAPGERVTETGVAARLQVSKTPVREALLRLQEVGLVEPDGVRGLRVVQPDAVALDHAGELLEVLGGHLAEQLAADASPELAGRLQQLARDSLAAAEAGDADAFRALDAAFHRALAVRNPRMAKVVADAVDLVRVLRERDFPSAAAMLAGGHAHVEIADAIAAGDARRAGEGMRDHLRSVRERVQRVDEAAGGS
jgi:DNA-binding GntR family transcriptional regulator